ncbi:two-component system response regulator [Sulfuricurvum sp.]|uniref:two-component system response regulator n=1 Tax=Sulfuricurvum sp. TaxID=2025608 RepID=UPI002D392FFE|nr:two-component system response regulator [Sulfuricurvum sp.]HZF71194.1 two-component system response regulator [Sulfuricurvum sp.]
MIPYTPETILIVDDSPENLMVLSEILKPFYKVKVATGGTKALNLIASGDIPDLILLDIMMPDISGYDVCKKLKHDPMTRNIPIIFVTALSDYTNEEEGLHLGAVDYITKPVNSSIVLARVNTHITLLRNQHNLEQKLQERTEEIVLTRMEVIRQLGRAAEFKDNETGTHILRMSAYAKLIAQKIGLDNARTELIYLSAPMHDIGKIGTPDAVLQKPGSLTPEEWEVIRKHPNQGADIIGNHHSLLLQTARIVSLTHHERFDGTGYPNGIKGYDIPLAGRIVAIADVFDALTSRRPYKEAWSIERAVEYLQDQKGKHFDGELVDIFLQHMDEIKAIMTQFKD